MALKDASARVLVFDSLTVLTTHTPGMINRMFNKSLGGILWFILTAGLGPGAAVAIDDFNGRWVGSWSSSELQDGGNLEIDITQSGSNLSGKATASGATDCGALLVLTLTGTVTGDGNTATFPNTNNTYRDPCIPDEQGRISLNVTRSGNTLSGSYTIEFFDNGVWNHADSGSVSVNRTCCTITASAGAGGTIAPSGTVTVAPGASKTFTAQPNAGFTIADLLVDNVSKGALASYSFTNIQTDHVIAATFTESKKSLPFVPLLLDEDGK
jgi:hypothetical protein